MKKIVSELFLHLASYSRWGTAEGYPSGLFRAFGEGLLPQRFDDRDPPRRPFAGDVSDVRFWMSKGEQEWDRWLFLRHKSKDHSLQGVVNWVDRSREPMKSRGDYSSLYMTIKTKAPTQIVEFWRSACIALQPFHGFLDTLDRYYRRAHEVEDDGQINKLTGWYTQRLPGFFAHNYFGTVYLRRWGDAARKIPASFTTPDATGLFVTAPSGFDFVGRMNEVYTPDDLAVIQALGPEWFHLPDQPDRVHAPSLAEFLAATPLQATSE